MKFVDSIPILILILLTNFSIFNVISRVEKIEISLKKKKNS